MSEGERLPLEHARALVKEVVDLLRDGCERIEIAGSIRREKATVHDLEIVAQPKGDALTLADDLLAKGVFIKRPKPGWGQRLKAGIYGGQNVDIFVSLPDRQFACTWWLRTGSGEANTTLVTQRYKGGILPDDLVFCAEQFWKLPASLASFRVEEVEACKKKGSFAPLGGVIVQTPDERDIFALAGLPFIPPRFRDEQTYRALAGRRLVSFHDVAHLWDADLQIWQVPGMTYIGRAMPQYNLPVSVWGNPFKLAKDTPDERARGVAQYRTHIAAKLAAGEARLEDLHDDVLVCWCKSLKQPDAICHGDVLLELLGQAAHAAEPKQAKLFSAADMRELEARAAERVEAQTAPRPPKPVEQFEWRKPWLADDGRVYVHTGYGEYMLFDADHDRARNYLEQLRRVDERSRTSQAMSLDAWLARGTQNAPSSPTPASEVVYAISLWEPWALLLALGEKQNETRSWRPPKHTLGRRFVIHAAKRWTGEERIYARLPLFVERLECHGFDPGSLPLGVALGTARLTGYLPTEQAAHQVSAQEQAFGNYAPERFAWQFAEFTLFPEFVPYRGQQGIWQWDLPIPA